MSASANGPLRVGIGGPVGSGKTTLTEKLCKAMRADYSIAVVTNDIYTKEDALILTRLQALPEDRIMGVETGGCPHTAIREDASINLQAIADMQKRFPDLDVVFIESGGDNLAATFSPDLADLTLYVISVCQGEKIPRKGGPALPALTCSSSTRSISPPMSAPISTSWNRIRDASAAIGPMFSPICSVGRVWRRLSRFWRAKEGWHGRVDASRIKTYDRNQFAGLAVS